MSNGETVQRTKRELFLKKKDRLEEREKKTQEDKNRCPYDAEGRAGVICGCTKLVRREEKGKEGRKIICLCYPFHLFELFHLGVDVILTILSLCCHTQTLFHSLNFNIWLG